ncbi:MAG TPA: 2-phosphosulfolactate phosphatase, partial [Gemmataceae bacterium]|nr:2-phosphosulfolactate phosphatase [Gemmataceae bacterium]
MPDARDVQVHLLPQLVPNGALAGSVAVAIDVLRATTTVIHALAAGCDCVRPCLEVEEARELADRMRAGRVILGGERGGRPLSGFDLGNSPGEYTGKVCRGTTLVLTTTNGTRAMLKAAEAERALIAGFVNYSAVCEQLRLDPRPIHIVCAGTEGEVSLEDTLLAGALVDFLAEVVEIQLNDAARMAWDCFENHGQMLQGALELSL